MVSWLLFYFISFCFGGCCLRESYVSISKDEKVEVLCNFDIGKHCFTFFCVAQLMLSRFKNCSVVVGDGFSKKIKSRSDVETLTCFYYNAC